MLTNTSLFGNEDLLLNFGLFTNEDLLANGGDNELPPEVLCADKGAHANKS